MKLIVGLGNPGEKYRLTRHNVGQRVIDSLVGEKMSAHLYKPKSLMNVCGSEIVEQLGFYKLTPKDLLVVHDELDLPFGELRLQFGRSSAGHHGVDSVIEALGTNAFWRLRVGIGPRGEVAGDQFVLERFSYVEEDKLEAVIKEAREKIKEWLKE
jgi:PTH1 family peptidyl-tRNA hydrolase